MADFESQALQSRAGAKTQDIPRDPGLRNFLLGIYQKMGLGLAITGAMAWAVANSPFLVQLLFRTPSRRALFRRRQVASRTATICEALVSIAWAGTGALLAAGSVIAFVPALIAGLVLLLAWALSRGRVSA